MRAHTTTPMTTRMVEVVPSVPSAAATGPTTGKGLTLVGTIDCGIARLRYVDKA